MPEPGHEARLRELFERAVALPAGEREELIAGIGDEVLAERLRALLEQDERGTASVLAQPASQIVAGLRRIGRYELLRELGSGGMGTVVLARQLEPIERLVALKLVQAGGDSKEVGERFATERQALALMNHPGIARIYDGGTTEDGTPYFVMEYVRGEPITTYCDRRRLGCDARIELFVKVCEAVQHAHQKAILHRDLKPGNVLVTEEGGTPQPKIIDFGVARALSWRVGAHHPTGGGLLVGTVAYMSPEQADARGQDVDTRADIYSLGVMLYELLTGGLPIAFDPESTGVIGFQRALLEESPPLASTRVQSLAAGPQAEVARLRAATPDSLHKELGGDLDWILMRTLEKDRNRRYAAAVELGTDLERHLRDEPVDAGPPTARYRIAKFVRRHRWPVLAAAMMVTGLVAGIVGTTRGMLEARHSRDVTQKALNIGLRRLQSQTALREYLEFLLLFGDRGTGKAPPSLRQVLDAMTPTIDARLGGLPVEEAAVRAGIGRAYLTTGEPQKAEAQLRRAWDLVSPDRDQDAANSCVLLYDLSRARHLAGGPGAGREDLIVMVELGAKALAEGRPELARRMRGLEPPLQRPAVDAAALQARCEDVLEAIEKQHDDVMSMQIAGRIVSAVCLWLLDEQVPGSDRFVERLEAVARLSLGHDVDFQLVLSRFAELQLRLGRFTAARRLAAEVLENLVRHGVSDHWLALRCERIRGLAQALAEEPAAGETALLALHRRLGSLPPEANEQTRAAAGALSELCARLATAGQLDAFLTTSLARWQQGAKADPGCAPWWPADVAGLPASAHAAARAAVERAAAGAGSPALEALRGGLLLREDRADAAALALAAALEATATPTPELRADAAIARSRIGDAAAAGALVKALRADAPSSGPMAARYERALARVVAAGLH